MVSLLYVCVSVSVCGVGERSRLCGFKCCFPSTEEWLIQTLGLSEVTEQHFSETIFASNKMRVRGFINM